MARIGLLLLAWFATCAQADDMLLGAGVRSRPDYDGASSRTVDLIPVLRYYGRPWFARTTQGISEGGIRGTLAQGFELGMQLTFASVENTRAYYGRSDSGHLYTDIGVLGSYDITRRWVAVGSVHVRRLNNDYPGFPERCGAYASAGVAYKY